MQKHTRVRQAIIFYWLASAIQIEMFLHKTSIGTYSSVTSLSGGDWSLNVVMLSSRNHCRFREKHSLQKTIRNSQKRCKIREIWVLGNFFRRELAHQEF